MTSGCIRLTPSKQTNTAAETLSPRMSLVHANDLETMFPCQVTQQQTFHCKQTLAHAQFRKLRACVTIQSSQHCFLGAQTGKHLFAETNCFWEESAMFFCSSETKNVWFGETFTETCFLNNIFVTMFPRLLGPLDLHVMVTCKVHGIKPCCFTCLSTLFLARIPTFFTNSPEFFELLI